MKIYEMVHLPAAMHSSASLTSRGVLFCMHLGTDENNAVIVLGASNRPWDIDEAIQRRLSRSFKVGLPSFNQRVQILKVILCPDPGADISMNDIDEIAKRTDKCVSTHDAFPMLPDEVRLILIHFVLLIPLLQLFR